MGNLNVKIHPKKSVLPPSYSKHYYVKPQIIYRGLNGRCYYETPNQQIKRLKRLGYFK
jgi:hypothetical protein